MNRATGQVPSVTSLRAPQQRQRRRQQPSIPRYPSRTRAASEIRRDTCPPPLSPLSESAPAPSHRSGNRSRPRRPHRARRAYTHRRPCGIDRGRVQIRLHKRAVFRRCTVRRECFGIVCPGLMVALLVKIRIDEGGRGQMVPEDLPQERAAGIEHQCGFRLPRQRRKLRPER